MSRSHSVTPLGAGTALPYQMNPTALYSSVILSSGGMTKRLDRLQSADLVERRADPGDRRGRLVALTAKGKAVVFVPLKQGKGMPRLWTRSGIFDGAHGQLCVREPSNILAVWPVKKDGRNGQDS